MKVPVRGFVTLLLAVIAGAPVAGCSAPAPEKVVTNPDPSGKIPAYKQAVRARDRKAARQMVKDLDSDDPAIRLFAIEGLRRMTGETFDYRYYDDEHARRPAIQRWQAWLDGDGDDGGGRNEHGDREAVARDDGIGGGAVTADGEAAPSKASGP